MPDEKIATLIDPVEVTAEYEKWKAGLAVGDVPKDEVEAKVVWGAAMEAGRAITPSDSFDKVGGLFPGVPVALLRKIGFDVPVAIPDIAGLWPISLTIKPTVVTAGSKEAIFDKSNAEVTLVGTLEWLVGKKKI